VNGELDQVTVLVGLAYKGQAKIGLISTPYGSKTGTDPKLDTSAIVPRLFVGDTR